MNALQAELEELTRDIDVAVKLVGQIEAFEANSTPASRSFSQATLLSNPSQEGRNAWNTILQKTNKLQNLLRDPVVLLQQLALQAQLLSCLGWLCEFQVLACIPLNHHVSFTEIADLAGVPDFQLTQIIRMTVTAGFLCEPEPGHVSHSPLSAQFVLKPSLLDALMFLSATAAPVALQMISTTRLHAQSTESEQTAYNLASGDSLSFTESCKQNPKLQRQWVAYNRLDAKSAEEMVLDLLIDLRWASLGHAIVVESGARSTRIASALTQHAPSLSFIVQGQDMGINSTVQRKTSRRPSALTPVRLIESQTTTNPRVTVQQRTFGALQPVVNAAVYIIHMPSPTPTNPATQTRAQLIAELEVHLSILRTSVASTLVVVARLLPEIGCLDKEVEAMIRVRDLTLHQLSNTREMGLQELTGILEQVADSAGRLIIVNKVTKNRNPFVTFQVEYRAHPDSSKNSYNNAFWLA